MAMAAGERGRLHMVCTCHQARGVVQQRGTAEHPVLVAVFGGVWFAPHDRSPSWPGQRVEMTVRAAQDTYQILWAIRLAGIVY